MGQNVVEISNILYANEIHRVDSPSIEDSIDIFFCQGNPNFWELMAQKLWENGQKQRNRLLWKIWKWSV